MMRDEWTFSGGWQFFDSMMVNDGSEGSLVSPYETGAADYAVEVEILLVYGEGNKSFDITIADGGVTAQIGVDNDRLYRAELYVGEDQLGLAFAGEERFDFGAGEWHTFRIEKSGNRVRLLINGVVAQEATNNRLIRVGPGRAAVVLGDMRFGLGGVQINVRGLEVIAL